ncbi:hypothetical protein TcG_12481 [Trypanosoma cruzi]|nr:hypothetical protein TcG_12481 [Trypanosoma cruzi]
MRLADTPNERNNNNNNSDGRTFSSYCSRCVRREKGSAFMGELVSRALPTKRPRPFGVDWVAGTRAFRGFAQRSGSTAFFCLTLVQRPATTWTASLEEMPSSKGTLRGGVQEAGEERFPQPHPYFVSNS